MKQKLTELSEETNKYTNTIGDINIPFSVTEGTVHYKSSKDKKDLNSPVNWIDIYRTLQPKTAKHKFLYCPWNIYQDRSSTDPETSLTKLKELKLYTVHSLITRELEINNKKIAGKFPNL